MATQHAIDTTVRAHVIREALPSDGTQHPAVTALLQYLDGYGSGKINGGNPVLLQHMCSVDLTACMYWGLHMDGAMSGCIAATAAILRRYRSRFFGANTAKIEAGIYGRLSAGPQQLQQLWRLYCCME